MYVLACQNIYDLNSGLYIMIWISNVGPRVIYEKCAIEDSDGA